MMMGVDFQWAHLTDDYFQSARSTLLAHLTQRASLMNIVQMS